MATFEARMKVTRTMYVTVEADSVEDAGDKLDSGCWDDEGIADTSDWETQGSIKEI